jgi:hypothetical protein
VGSVLAERFAGADWPWYAHHPPLVTSIPQPNASVPDAGGAALANPESGILLSVLIPTVESRRQEFGRLASKLNRQIAAHQLEHAVEILYFLDNCQYTVGFKRNWLMSQSHGRFVAFVDDDDDVDDEYLPLLCQVIAANPEIDCIGFLGEMTWSGRNPEMSIYSVRYAEQETLGTWAGHHVYLRPPLHLNPIRRDIAIQYPFPEINAGEDRIRSRRMVQAAALRNEYFLGERVLYRYLFDPRRTLTQAIGR